MRYDFSSRYALCDSVQLRQTELRLTKRNCFLTKKVVSFFRFKIKKIPSIKHLNKNRKVVFAMKKEELPVYKNNEELPLVLSTSDIAGYLNISLSMAYELMRAKDFPSIQIKRCYKVQREQFLQWINQTTGKVL